LQPQRTQFRAGDPVEIRVAVTNQGTARSDAFWVDVYINPSAPPNQPNQPWNTRCQLQPCFGMAWRVAGLEPGQTITLSSAALQPGYANWPGWFAAGTSDLYAYADSWNPGQSFGHIAESNEQNNRAELHGLVVSGPNPSLRISPVLSDRRPLSPRR
jgi:subtilase family serine protease